MKIDLFDANACIGRRIQASAGRPETAAQLIAEMDRLDIGRALVSHWSSWESEPALGNERLVEETAGHLRLVGCWTAVPDQGEELQSPAEFVAFMLGTWRAGRAGLSAAHELVYRRVVRRRDVPATGDPAHSRSGADGPD